MEPSSKESDTSDSDTSDSETSEYVEKIYLRLREGQYKVINTEGTFHCPFCPGQEQNYNYKNLLQHATGMGASNSKGNMRATHCALTKYLTKDMTDHSSPRLLAVCQPGPSKSKQEEQFVWPLMGIIANVPTESGNKLKEQLSRFKPLKVHPLWNFRGHTGNAVVYFIKDWNGFNDALAFENHFQAEHCGKRDWLEWNHSGSKIFGWIARADDYYSSGPVGYHLRKNGDLKSVREVVTEESHKSDKLLANLANQIYEKYKRLQELECKYNEVALSLDEMLEERELLLQAYKEEIQKMQNVAHDHSRKLLLENEMLRTELDSRQQELEMRQNQLDKLVAHNDIDKRKLDDEKHKNGMKNSSLQLARMEQKKADEKLLKLLEDHKREKESALKKILDLEKQLNQKQRLELEIQQIKGQLKIVKHMEGEEDAIMKRKIDEMTEHLKEKCEELDDLEALNQTLIDKERLSNSELQEARTELIHGLGELSSSCTSIGIKWMGELDFNAFLPLCKLQCSTDEAETRAVIYCSRWQEELRNPDWQPFKIVSIDGKTQEVVKEDDEKIQALKEEFGGEAYKAVITALLELKENNPTGRCPIPELWNFEKGRKATLKEVTECIMELWKAQIWKRCDGSPRPVIQRSTRNRRQPSRYGFPL